MVVVWIDACSVRETMRCRGASSKVRFMLKAMCALAGSRVESRCAFKLGSSLHRPNVPVGGGGAAHRLRVRR